MDLQEPIAKTEILGFPDLTEQFWDFDFDSTTWLSSTLDLQKVSAIENLRNISEVQKNPAAGTLVSTEELKILRDLEMEIEKDLEEEIKDNIYHLALRLHRLYRNRKGKNSKEAYENGNRLEKRDGTLSEVNISIRMEGGTKIEIKETKKEDNEKGRPRSSRSENVKQRNIGVCGRKFDWAKSLRDSSVPVSGCFSNVMLEKGKGKNGDSLGQGKRNVIVDKRMPQLGWRV